MNGKKAFVLVGHSNWGKSRTLRELLSSNACRQSWTEVIVNVWLFMKRTSNDDDPESLLRFVREIDSQRRPLQILALCPSFSEEPKKKLILELLQKKYTIFFFVLRKIWDGSDEIDSNDIQTLREYGTVEVLTEQTEFKQRGKAFRKFIKKHI